MVDVSKIKQGDTIKFRNGEVHTVTEAMVHRDRPSITIWIGQEDCFTYGEDSGGLYLVETAWDIVEHIPAKEIV